MTRPSLNRPEDRTMSYLIPPPTPRPGVRQDEEERMPLLMPSSDTLANTQVYALIHLIRVDVTSHIDTPLTTDQLLAPDSTYTIVRPLTEKYASMENHSIIFCLLLNRVQFLKDATQLSINTLSMSRASLCEILAIRVLRGWSERTLALSNLLLIPWALFQGASPAVIERVKEEGDDDEDIAESAGNALEMAILGNAKRFIRSPSAQKVIEGIWSGKVIYHAVNQHALISDNYKKKPIRIYNPHKAPLLDHYRLKVPKVRAILEYTNFIILFILYVQALEGLGQKKVNARESLFIIYAMGFTLDKLAAMREHGLRVFAANLWNGFDLAFIVIYLVYLTLRMYGMRRGEEWARELSIDILAMGAVGMFPRLAFVTLSNNLMILSLRSMMAEFFILMSIATFCFLGFSYALWTLGGGEYSWSQIGWYLLEVYFGLDATGFRSAYKFHRVLGPILMVSFACLANTLLLTVLVAILSNTFAHINADAAAESMFRRAVSTLEYVKADAVFSYQLPFNVVAVIIMFPLSFVLTPRWFHKVNVFMIRATSFPILLAIAVYERQKYHPVPLDERIERWFDRNVGTWPRKFWNGLVDTTGLDSFAGAGRDIDIVFEIEKEIGDFYHGWDDEGALEEEEESPSDDDDERSKRSSAVHSETEEIITTSPTAVSARSTEPQVPFPSSSPKNFPRSSTTPVTITPITGGEHIKKRRGSLPAAERAVDPSILASGISPRRRRGSIMEPSPLARLFVRSPPVESHMPRSLLGHRAAMSASLGQQSNTLLNHFAENPADHHRHKSLSGMPSTNNATAPLQTIPAGKRVSFSVAKHHRDTRDKDQLATASALQEDLLAGEPNAYLASDMHAMQDKLNNIEKQQAQIQKMLQRLLATSSSSAAEGRRNSAVSMEGI